VFELYRSGHLAVSADAARFTGLEGVYDGIEHLLSGRSIGKVMVEIRTSEENA
jgi:NADPH-dependent curcumin reductase CurA